MSVCTTPMRESMRERLHIGVAASLPRGLLVLGDVLGYVLLVVAVGLEGTVWRRGVQHHTTYVLHPEKHHNGGCADCQKTTAVLIATSALCVCGSRGGGKCVLVKGGGCC